MVAEKQKAPEFELATDEGRTVKLSDFKGRKVILYFYPKDDTPGCTTQACDLRDHIQEIDSRGAVVLGVSPDDVASHKKFKEKFGLNFTLLADVGHQVAEAYGVWKEKNLYGRKSMGVERTSFIIDEQGNIAKILPRVKPAEHVGQLLELV
jgi:thioredoxin-dependent peroxiredoxin